MQSQDNDNASKTREDFLAQLGLGYVHRVRPII